MIITNFNQGEDIPVLLTFVSGANEDITSFDDFDEVIAYIYTNRIRRIRFSDVVRVGYYPLMKVDSTHRSGVIPAAFTATMQVGKVFVELMTVKDGTRSVGVEYETCIAIEQSQIKEEAL
jgi:hypothetical protein